MLASFSVILLRQELSRRSMAELVRNTEASIALASASGNIGLWNWDDDGDKVRASDRCREMLGIEGATPFSLETLLRCTHPEDRANVRQAIKKAIATGQQFDLEHRLASPGRQPRWVVASGRAKCDRNGRVVGLNGALVDVTQRKALEAESAKRVEQVTHLTRVDILGELSGAIAHELNQPLMAILANAQAVQRMLSGQSVDVVELREAVGEIIDDDKRAGEIIRHFRALLEKSEAHFEVIDLNTVVSRALEFSRPGLSDRQVQTVLRLSNTPLPVRGDPIQLQQVILNLVLNASDAMLANAGDNRVLTISTTYRNGAIEAVVSDNGPGIPPQKLPLLFEAFHTTKKNGLGLGLSISRSIISAHGGKLWAANALEGGAQFCLRLPAIEDCNND
jgi:C4-dicarboxylate-specific signal transduction histidine kinase